MWVAQVYCDMDKYKAYKLYQLERLNQWISCCILSSSTSFPYTSYTLETKMAGRPFPLQKWMAKLQKNFHREISNGNDPRMLKEQEIGSSPNFFSVEAGHIDPCLTDEQKRKASGSQCLSVFGLNVDGDKWNLLLRKVNGTYFFSETGNKVMTKENGWEPGTQICIWGVPVGGAFRDGKVRFLFTNGL